MFLCTIRSIDNPCHKKKRFLDVKRYLDAFVLFDGFVNDHTFGHTDDIHLTFKCPSFQGTIKALLLKLLRGLVALVKSAISF